MACGGGLHAFGAEQILHANRHTRHFSQRLASGAVGIDGLRGFDGLFRRFNDESVEDFGGSDIGVEGFSHFNSLEFAGCDAKANGGNAEFG